MPLIDRQVTESGYSPAQVARDLGVQPDILRRWRRQLEEDPEQAFPGVGQRKSRDEEVWRPRRELERVTQERDTLRMRSASSRTAGGEVRLHPAAYPALSRGDAVPGPGGLPERLLRLARPPGEPASRNDRRPLAQIRAIHRQSRRTYGSPRLHAELRELGHRCGRHRVARLMRQDHLRGACRRKFQVTTQSRHRFPVAPNRLGRRFAVSLRNRVRSRSRRRPRASAPR